MKRNIVNNLFSISFAIAFLCWNNSIAQEVKPAEETQKELTVNDYKVSLKFTVTKQEDYTRLLVADYSAKNKKDRKDILPVYDAEIEFYNVLDDQEILLGAAKTGKDGIAKLIVPADRNYLKDNEGNIVFVARYPGNEGLDAIEEEIVYKDLILELSLKEVDSVKTVTAIAYTTDSTGVKIPVEEADINFYIGGMLSKMKIEEASLSGGEYEFELKELVPGDPEGNISIYAMIEDDDVFGNVNQMQSAKWGRILSAETKKKGNTLWSKAAPIWMYVVLTILLVGVWANYLYTIVHLFKIRRESRNLELET